MGNLENILQNYLQLNLSTNIDFDKFNQYAITHHSTTIEGSTLTEIETRLLLDEGLTPKGKPLLHSLMVQDHFNALVFVIETAKKKQPVTVSFVQQLNALVMKHTGSIYETVFGSLHASQGVFRKGNVSAGNSYFVSYDKVEKLMEQLCSTLNEKLMYATSVEEQLKLSFDAHFNLVTIHPFYDGNGRTSRLLMNYLQQYFNLPMAIVFKEDKVEYFEALQQTRKEENIQIFRNFMYGQYQNFLSSEIEKANAVSSSNNKSGFNFLF